MTDAHAPLARARAALQRNDIRAAMSANREALEAAGSKALEVLTTLMDIGEPREQNEAARAILAAQIRMWALPLPDDAAPKMAAGMDLTREQRIEVLRQCLAAPDDELAEALRVEGWRR
jgi:hypothetical protein